MRTPKYNDFELMKYIILINILAVFLCSCTNNKYRLESKQYDTFAIVENIDPSAVIAAVKPFSYPWNSEGKLVDLFRKKYKQVSDDGYPNPFCPPTYILINVTSPDTIIVFFCNEDESSCLKITEDYLKTGEYSIGFQKVDIKPGNYKIKIVNSDSTFSRNYTLNVLFLIPCLSGKL